MPDSTLAQLSPPDMRVPIQYAFSWPQRLPAERRALDLPALASLTFRAPSEERFPCLRLVKEAARAGGTQTAALSAADEIAVERFLSGEILYTDSWGAGHELKRMPEDWAFAITHEAFFLKPL